VPGFRRLCLSAAQRRELTRLRDHAPAPYLLERAAALLKIADGQALKQVARHGLLLACDEETVSSWLDRYQAQGAAACASAPAAAASRPSFLDGLSAEQAAAVLTETVRRSPRLSGWPSSRRTLALLRLAVSWLARLTPRGRAARRAGPRGRPRQNYGRPLR
jgi:hypothetical protein